MSHLQTQSSKRSLLFLHLQPSVCSVIGQRWKMSQEVILTDVPNVFGALKSCWPAKSRVLSRELSGRLELKVDGLEQTLPLTLLSVTLTCTPAQKVSSFQRRQISFEVSTLF